MNKKGFFLGTIVDIYGWIIFILGIVVWLLAFSWAFGGGSAYTINEKQLNINNDGVLLNYLSTPIEGKGYNLIDLLTMAYEGKENKDLLKEEMSLILGKVYPEKPVCWNIWYYEGEEKKLLANEKCKGKTKLLFDAATIIPLTEGDSLIIRLTIPGYK